MIRPDPNVLKVITGLSRNRDFVDWLENWRRTELDRLPNVQPDTVQVAQGRCQVLTELYKLIQDTKNLPA
jgi:hypothetical protein